MTETLLEEKLLTPQEVAVMFRVTDRTVRRWLNAGKVDGAVRMPSGRWRVRESAVNIIVAP